MTTHGLSPRGRRHYLYQTWLDIRKRCYLPSTRQYPRYGGRGIRMHEPWRSDAAAFADWVLSHLGERPVGMSIDRIDNDGHYEPGNIRWATRRQQSDNQTRKPPSATGRGIQLVVMSSGRERYRARITVDGRSRHVGYFDTAEQASAAIDQATIKLLASV